MRKIIAIGESSYNIIFQGNSPTESFTGGKIINAAASIASSGIPTSVVSECGKDFIGKMILEYLERNKVCTKSIDCFTEGETSLQIIKDSESTLYGSYPNDRFSVVWPRIDENDIVIFGSFYSIEPNVRERLLEMLQYASDRKAILIYIPGFHQKMNYRITKVMTAILENLEMANLVIAYTSDMKAIFNDDNQNDIFKKRLEFYCPNYLHIESKGEVNLFSPNKTAHLEPKDSTIDFNNLGCKAGFLAGIVFGLVTNDIKLNDMNSISAETWDSIIDTANNFAINVSKNTENCITSDFASQCQQIIENLEQNQENLL